MRATQKQGRPRGRGQRKSSNGNSLNRVHDSSGPEGKVRGTPQQIVDKYLALARDAQTSGDRVVAENFLQHAEHYQRILTQAMQQQADRREQSGSEADQDGASDGQEAAGPERAGKGDDALATIEADGESDDLLVEDGTGESSSRKPRGRRGRSGGDDTAPEQEDQPANGHDAGAAQDESAQEAEAAQPAPRKKRSRARSSAGEQSGAGSAAGES